MDIGLHTFSQYIRIIGRGKKGARALSQEEACKAMGMILDGFVEPEQLGAFLMLIRVKEEAASEVAGFVNAVRERMDLPDVQPKVDVDWSSYAGKRRHLPWFILSVLALADNGIKVFMHGMLGRKDDRTYTPDVLAALDIPISHTLGDAAHQVESSGFAYLGLERLFPRLQQLIELRDILGLRTPIHTVARMLNPFNAPCQMQGVFHPGYLSIHQDAAVLLQQPRMAVIKGEGGEVECNPDAICPIYSVRDSENRQEEWPSMYTKRHTKPKTLDICLLTNVWRGVAKDEYGLGAVVSTMAVTLYTMGKADTKSEAFFLAEDIWRKRSKDLV